ncbi:hypothetical protein BH11ACT8_BH11ACT8_04350 [soil metagenome]
MKTLEVEEVTPSCTYLRGYQVRQLVADVNGRPPIWATRARAWVVQPSSVPDIVAEAERRGWNIVLLSQGGEPWRPGPTRRVS